MKAKKLLAILLSAVMLIGIVPMTAFGAAPANPFFDDFEGDFEQFWGTVGNKDLVAVRACLTSTLPKKTETITWKPGISRATATVEA